MATAITVSALLALVTVLLNFEVLSIVGAMRRRFSLPMRVEVLYLIVAAVFAHLVSIGLYALAYAWMAQHPELGSLSGETTGSAGDFFYFSVACYTTLGFGEIFAIGPIRIVAALEGLNGLVLITWSASFAYAATSGLWDREGG
ncbi:ion channel [Kumtagia ephedrae]|uniref:ion channel n=1 Tax=Kumtagia ephedrae TaxID=2116701 RepID=UPI001FE19D65|nr:ion channel [Mesorhizobium ephedrae]